LEIGGSMDKLINKKFEIAAAEDVKKTLAEIRALVEEHKWENRKVYPYSYPVNIIDFLDQYRDYDNFTYMSKQLALDEINGLIEHCVNPWLEYENKPKVKIWLKKEEKFLETTNEMAEILIEAGLADPFH